VSSRLGSGVCPDFAGQLLAVVLQGIRKTLNFGGGA
jgi:hypothetical protein